MDDGARRLWVIGGAGFGAGAEALAARIAAASGGTMRPGPVEGAPPPGGLCLLWDRPERAAEAALAADGDPQEALARWCDAAEAALAVQARDRRGTLVFEGGAAAAALPLVLGRLGLDSAADTDPADPDGDAGRDPILALVAAHALERHPRARHLAGALEAASQPLGNGAAPEDTLPPAEVVAAFRGNRAELARLRAERDAAQQARETLEASTAAMLAEMDLVEREAHAIAAERDAAQVRARAATDEAARLMGSRSMRLTAPLRGFAARLRGH
ncbi:hypothetical protein [Citreimonas salinaria]|uniref:Uncharacterized protein n=1 Tax=Citreimonas salinaria TaxID=321339 RepID=A0A1H3N461_9RHOB|nr:hypothetical protein [Citreimonas salinaria]SDY83751.1 hypothetical protein SAMN05444340_12025 [Citreimonas salinaria]